MDPKSRAAALLAADLPTAELRSLRSLRQRLAAEPNPKARGPVHRQDRWTPRVERPPALQPFYKKQMENQAGKSKCEANWKVKLKIRLGNQIENPTGKPNWKSTWETKVRIQLENQIGNPTGKSN